MRDSSSGLNCSAAVRSLANWAPVTPSLPCYAMAGSVTDKTLQSGLSAKWGLTNIDQALRVGEEEQSRDD